MRAIGLVLLGAILSHPFPANAQSGMRVLTVDSDRCSIFHALTGEVLSGCPSELSSGQIVRSVNTQEANGYVIHFDFDSEALKQAEKEHLARLSDLLSGPLTHLCVKLVGHTDTRGRSGYNQRLSERRAQSVRLFLVGPGQIDVGRVLSAGLGEQHPIAGLPGADSRNRRVEVLGKETSSGQCT